MNKKRERTTEDSMRKEFIQMLRQVKRQHAEMSDVIDRMEDYKHELQRENHRKLMANVRTEQMEKPECEKSVTEPKPEPLPHIPEQTPIKSNGKDYWSNMTPRKWKLLQKRIESRNSSQETEINS